MAHFLGVGVVQRMMNYSEQLVAFPQAEVDHQGFHIQLIYLILNYIGYFVTLKNEIKKLHSRTIHGHSHIQKGNKNSINSMKTNR